MEDRDILSELMPDVEPVKIPERIELDEWVFTNDKTNPGIRQLFRMFHQSVFDNKVGLMHAKVKGSDNVVTLLVLVEVLPDNQIITWPLAKVLTEEEQTHYCAPDGNGGFID